MKIITVQFDYPGRNQYDKLLNVFLHSAAVNMPEVEVVIVKLSAPEIVSSPRGFASNTIKLAEWLRCLNETDEDLIFMDCDMMITGDMSSAFDDPDFDIGYTKRSGNCRIPFNGGVVFVRNNERAVAFIEKWREVNDQMFNDKAFHYPWRQAYAGMNQSAFGYIYEKVDHGAKLKPFPCRIWNACTEDWVSHDEHVKAVHVKSGLRRACLGERKPFEPMMKVYEIWRAFAAEAGVEVGKPLPPIKKVIVSGNHPPVHIVTRTARRRGRHGRRLAE